MPIFEFHCLECGNNFEDLCTSDKISSICPECGSPKVEKIISAPSPLKKGAFPFKPGAPHPVAGRMASGCSACGSGGCEN